MCSVKGFDIKVWGKSHRLTNSTISKLVDQDVKEMPSLIACLEGGCINTLSLGKQEAHRLTQAIRSLSTSHHLRITKTDVKESTKEGKLTILNALLLLSLSAIKNRVLYGNLNSVKMSA